MSTNKAVAKRNIKTLLSDPGYKQRFQELLGARAPQFMASIIAVSRSLPATTDPQSIISSAAVAATLDLPIQKDLGFAWIVPYAGKAQFQLGYKGYIQLAQRTGQYKTINVITVYDGELQKIDPLTGEIELDPSKRAKDAAVIGYAAIFRLINGFEKTEYWTIERVRDHAKRFSQAYRKKKDDSPWTTDFDAMAMKTVLKSLLSKWGILSVQMQHAIKFDQSTPSTIDIDAETDYPDNQKEAKRPKFEDPPELFKTGDGEGADAGGDDVPYEDQDDLTKLRVRMAEAKITDQDMLDHMRGAGIADESLASLEEVMELSPSSIAKALDAFDTIAKKIAKESKSNA